eukprot:Phypoly_transcript_19603.p1 GENE.Phypoly_transcript_19603~~Phypoly_transcript_19603.p1  ORF type:complete len:123 (+),score=16.09 Phypoly_transcript_19603:40-369(+)
MASNLSNILRVRGRDALYYVVRGTCLPHTTQFWEGYIRDRNSTTPVPLSTLQYEICEYNLRLSFKENKILATTIGWDGVVYKTIELAAAYITEDEVFFLLSFCLLFLLV